MFNVLILLFSLFIFGLAVRNFFFKNLCALCLSVSLTWLYLLYEYWFQDNSDPLVLGILLGGSVVGGMYYLFPKISERYQIFKFPLLVSAFWFIYQLLGFSNTLLEEVILLIALWAVFFILFLFYTNQRWQTLGKEIIECCKNW